MEQISIQELKQKLSDLLAHDALEFIDDPAPDAVTGKEEQPVSVPAILIPYMMSDEVEYYFTLTGATITGTIPHSLPSGTILEVFDENGEPIREDGNAKETAPAENGSGGAAAGEKSGKEVPVKEFARMDCAISFRDGFEPLFTVWFQSAYKSVKLYRYDREGHYWTEGQEHMKRLVYMLGSTADKLKYLGPAFLNEEEMEMQELIGFKPFRNYSPIEESMDEYYHSTKEGARRMRALAAEAGDDWLYVFTWLYQLLPLKILELYLSDYLISERGERIYEIMLSHIHEMNESYPDRSYGEEKDREIQRKREDLSRFLYSRGFSGTYPAFSRTRTKDGKGECMEILVTEEKSYAKKVLDWKDFDFDMDLLIKKTDHEGHITRLRLRDHPQDPLQ